MYRRLAALVILGLLLGTAGFAAEAVDAGAAASFWWDVTDTEITTQSRGTGGVPTDPPEAERRGITWGHSLSELETTYPAAWRSLTDYLETLADAFDCAPQRLYCNILDERLLLADVWGILWDTSGLLEEDYGGRRRTAVFDLQTGKRLELSDLFYDGENYIRILNEAAALALSYGKVDSSTFPLGEESLRRPFTGFPADYPYFSITGGEYGGRLLKLYVNRDNPLFSVGVGGAYLTIPLRTEHSPYGLPWAEITMGHAEAPMPEEDGFLRERPERFDPEDGGPSPAYYTVRVDLEKGDDDPVQQAVDDRLEALVQQALTHPLRYLQGADRPMAPYVHFDARGMLHVSYYAITDKPDYGSWHMALLGALEIDLATGEVLDGRNLRDSPGVTAYAREEGERVYDEVAPEELTLYGGAMYLGAWTSENRETGARELWAAWLEASGEETYFSMPMEE